MNELPEKIEHTMVTDLTTEQKVIYVHYLSKIKEEIETGINENGFEKSRIKIMKGLTRLRQICCHPSLCVEGFDDDSGKLLLLQEIVEEYMEGGHRILLFSQFTSMLSIIRRWLENSSLEYLYLDGSTGTEERKESADRFNSGHGKLFLISLKAGGTGLNLTGADTVIHYDLNSLSCEPS